ncbi:transposase family protein [Actinokineospora sp. NBRC 105648]|uniref:transposase family protein n=1 Tax=Actinokineospora sp. NBRC 105648 TaxID=3032206 RepID=UPI00331A8820
MVHLRHGVTHDWLGVGRSTVTRAVDEIRPILAERGCRVGDYPAADLGQGGRPPGRHKVGRDHVAPPGHGCGVARPHPTRHEVVSVAGWTYGGTCGWTMDGCCARTTAGAGRWC